MEKLSQSGEGGGYTATLFHDIYHHVQVVVYTPPVSSLYPYMYFVVQKALWRFITGF
jgi:hypothetical protein